MKKKIKFLIGKWIKGQCRHICKLCPHKKYSYNHCFLEILYEVNNEID